MEEAFEHKKLQYADFTAEVCPAEVGCRSFVASSIARLLREVGVREQAHRKAIRALANTAEKSNYRLWLMRRDPIWAPKGPSRSQQ